MIHLVTGKGGVGKSTYAAALALHLAQLGQRTLLVELGERSYQRHLFQTPVTFAPAAVQSHLSLALWDGEGCLREYLLHLLKVERLVSLFFDNKIMGALVQAAPALRELAILGKITSGVRKVGPAMPFDSIVVDAYSTGHFRALWRSARGMAEAIPFGPMGTQSRGMEAVVCDPKLCRIHVVANSEELPMAEALELSRDIQSELKQTPLLILNRVLATPIAPAALEQMKGNEFAQYISVILARQELAERTAEQRGFKAVTMPWILEGTPSERVRQLAQKVVFS